MPSSGDELVDLYANTPAACAKASRIKVSKDVKDLFLDNEAENNFSWLLDNVTLFQKVFSTHIKNYKSL